MLPFTNCCSFNKGAVISGKAFWIEIRVTWFNTYSIDQIHRLNRLGIVYQTMSKSSCTTAAASTKGTSFVSNQRPTVLLTSLPAAASVELYLEQCARISMLVAAGIVARETSSPLY